LVHAEAISGESAGRQTNGHNMTLRNQSAVAVRQSLPGRGVGGERVPTVGSRCTATRNEDTDGLLSATVNCKVRELVKWLQLLIAESCKRPVTPVFIPNPV
jgi:hypothetical protein